MTLKKKLNNYCDDCWQCRVYEPIKLSDVKVMKYIERKKTYMNEDFVSFELGKKLKEKGFPQIEKGTLAMYDEEGEIYLLSATLLDQFEYNFKDFDKNDCVAPTISQVLKWLREEKNVDIVIYPIDASTIYMGGENYILSVYINRKRDYKLHHNGLDKYIKWNDAALAGIEYCLDNLI